jgi:hypothetical protein
VAGERVLEGWVGLGVAQEIHVNGTATQRANCCADRQHAGHEGVVSAPGDEGQHASHAPVLVSTDRNDRACPHAPDARGAPCDVREGADEERVQARGIEEDALGFFRDRCAHVIRGSAGAGTDGFGERRDFSEAADGDRCRERGQDRGDFEAQVEARVCLGDAADRTVASV